MRLKGRGRLKGEGKVSDGAGAGAEKRRGEKREG
jgi:hypothetical protein